MRNTTRNLISATALAAFIFLAFGSDDDKTTTTTTTGSSTAEASKPDVEILSHDSQYEATMQSYTIHCRVKNNTDALVTYVDLKATFYDKAGKIVGTGMGNAVNFAGNSEKTIDVFAMQIDNADHYEVAVDNVMN